MEIGDSTPCSTGGWDHEKNRFPWKDDVDFVVGPDGKVWCWSDHQTIYLQKGVIDMKQPKVTVEGITAALWTRIDQKPDEVVYYLTWEDVVSVLAQEMTAQGMPPEAFTQDDLEKLLEAGRVVNLPWQETLEVLLMLDWPDPCRFDIHKTGTAGKPFVTTTLFWECECQQRYLSPRSQEQCPDCRIHRSDAPDARLNEIWSHAAEISPALLAYLRESWENHLLVDTGVGVGVYSK